MIPILLIHVHSCNCLPPQALDDRNKRPRLNDWADAYDMDYHENEAFNDGTDGKDNDSDEDDDEQDGLSILWERIEQFAIDAEYVVFSLVLFKKVLIFNFIFN